MNEPNLKSKTTRVSIASICVLLGLIFVNVMLALPPHSALSDSKESEAQKAQKKAGQRAAPSSHLEDFGAETIEPLKGPGVIPLSPDLVEEPQSPEALPEQPTPAPAAESAAAADNEENETVDPTVTTSLNGNEIDIAVLVKTFSKLTKRNYIVDNNVKGKVAIHLATPVSIEEALRIFESVLLLKGFTTVPMGNNTWKVIAAKDARQTTIPMLEGAADNSSDALVTELIRLKNTQAAELQQVLQQFVSKDGVINAFGATNALILIDSAANIKRLRQLVEQLDVPAVDQDITIIPIVHADAKDVAEKIESILGEKSDDSQAGGANAVRTRFLPNTNNVRPGIANPPGANPQAGVSTSGEKRTLPLKLIPDDRTNSLICVADALMTQKVRALAEQLDSPVDRSGGKFYVYRLKHADAETVAEILNAAISGEGGSTSGSTSSTRSRTSSSSTTNSGLSGSSNRNSITGSDNDRSSQRSTRRERSPVVGAKFGGEESGAGKVNLEGEVTVAADTSTNSLVINASRGDYEKIKELLEALDVKRRQVLVEATILEVSLTKNVGLGTEWQISGGNDDAGAIGQTNFGGISNLLSNPAALSDLTIAAASSGSIVLPGGITLPSQAILITALSRNQNVNVLSTPTILAIDNEEAEIKVGENVPFVTSTSTNQTNLNNTFNQIERQDVGIKLRITPQISAGDFVVLQIFVEISNVVAGTRNDPNGPTTTIRTTETVVEVKSEQMVVTGGLIADSVTDSSRGVPYLEDLPVLGNLFRRDDNERRRNNLLVFITPRIVDDQFVAREQTMTKRDKLEDAIEEQGTEPDRAEVLHSEDIDHVVEARTFEKRDSTTITPPKDSRASAPATTDVEMLATKRTESRLKELVGDSPSPANGRSAVVDPAAADEEIEIEVKPDLPGKSSQEPRGSLRSDAKLPAAEKREAKPADKKSAERSGDSPAAKISDKQELARAAGQPSYVILRQVDRTGGDSLPFEFSDDKGTLEVLYQTGSGGRGGFFQPGARYTFRGNGTTVHFVCLGSYGSVSEVRQIHPGLDPNKKWYTVSEQFLKSSGWSAG